MPKRIYEHRTGVVDGFTKRYGVKVLVWYEPHDSIDAAIAHEKAIKKWNRAHKFREIEPFNPDWRAVYAEIATG